MAFDITEFVKSVPNRYTSREQIEYIHISQLLPDPDNFYSMDGIEELAANIATAGLQQPIRVYVNPASPENYIILSGHRRHAALQLLVEDDPEKWEQVPCIVERDNVPLEARKLRLLLANRDTRKLTSADLDRQAADLEKYIVALKEQGYSFPGRLSDYVAKTLDTSKTKLNRLKIIREGLIPEWRKLWEAGKINDSVGYSLAHADCYVQKLYYDNYGNKPQSVYAYSVDSNLKRIETLPESCKKHGGNCWHLQEMKAVLIDPNNSRICLGCCMDCFYLESCKNSCPEADELKEQKKREKKELKAEEKRDIQNKEAPILDYLGKAFSRVYGLMREKKLTVPDMLHSDGSRYTYNESKFLENLQGKKITISSKLPFGWGVDYDSIHRILCAAELLGVSTDYLLTGKEAPKASGWQTGEPEEDGQYIINYGTTKGHINLYDKALWSKDDGWALFGNPISEYDYQVFAWVPTPKEV